MRAIDDHPREFRLHSLVRSAIHARPLPISTVIADSSFSSSQARRERSRSRRARPGRNPLVSILIGDDGTLRGGPRSAITRLKPPRPSREEIKRTERINNRASTERAPASAGPRGRCERLYAEICERAWLHGFLLFRIQEIPLPDSVDSRFIISPMIFLN